MISLYKSIASFDTVIAVSSILTALPVATPISAEHGVNSAPAFDALTELAAPSL
jgi:hypothetical protein